MSDTDETPDALDDIGYAAAVDELEAILAVLERDDLDIDVLGPQVQRAARLIRICRDRIAGARHDVEQIIADIAGLTAPPAGTEIAIDGGAERDDARDDAPTG